MTTTLTLALILSVLSPAFVSAQSDTARLADLVITATRVPVTPGDVAAATTVIRGDDLRARGVQLVLDALREVPGVMVVQAGSYGAQTSLFLRGGESNYVKVLLDGVPLNRPGGSINWANLTTVDLDRIEIVRGPASVLYGADAMSGVVQLFTRAQGTASSVELAARGGTFSSADVNGHLAVQGKAWSLSATGSHEATDGVYAFNNEYRNNVGSVRIGAGSESHGHGALTLRYGSGLAHFPTDGGGAMVDHNQFTTEKTLAMGLDAAWPVGSSGTFNLHGFASRLNEAFTNRSDTPADTSGFAFIDDRSSVSWRRGVDARLDRHVHGSVVSLGAGLEHENDEEHDVSVSDFGFGVSHDTLGLTGDRTTRNLFLQVLSQPAAKVSSQLGVRVDDNSAFGTFTTWRVGATLHVRADTRLWVAVGTAFKAPTFSQLFAQGAFEVGNPDLAPERSRNSEVGLERTLADHQVTVSVTAFWQRFRDLIQYVSAAPGDPTYLNLGGANARGVEFSAAITPTPRLSINAHWTRLHTEVTDTGSASSLTFQQGASLIRRPASSGGGTATYRWHGLTLAGTVTRIGTRDDADFSGFPGTRVILPAYTTVDLGFDLPVKHGGGRSLDLTLRGENLFNVAYQQAFGFSGRGRALFAGGRARF